MALYDIETTVTVYFQVEADSLQEAEMEGWQYHDVNKYEPEYEVQAIKAELSEEDVND